MKKMILASICAVLVSLSSYGGVTAKLGSVKLETKKGDYPIISYSYRLTTDQQRIKRPILSCYIIVEHPDSTRSTYYDISILPSLGGQAAYSARAPEVDVNKVKSFQGKTVGSPFYPNYVFAEKDKILILRCELWQDGVLLDAYSSKTDSEIKKLGLRSGWYKTGN